MFLHWGGGSPDVRVEGVRGGKRAHAGGFASNVGVDEEMEGEEHTRQRKTPIPIGQPILLAPHSMAHPTSADALGEG